MRAVGVLLLAWSSPALAQTVDVGVPAAPPADAAPAVDAAPPAPEPAPAPSTEITVQGDRANALKHGSGSGTVITEKEIQRAQPESAAEMLRRVPGLQVRQEDPMGLRLNLGVRGLSPTRSRLVLVEEDGVPVVVSPYGEPELYYMTSIERIRRVDVIKGSDVLEYGPQTVGSVIRLHTWDPSETPSWHASATLGSRGYGEALARYSSTYHDVGYVLQAFHKGGDGYRNMGFSASDVMGKVQFATGADGEVTIKLGFHDELARTTYTGLTDALYQENPRRDTIAPDDHFAIQRYEVAITQQQRLGDQSKLTTTAFAYEMKLGLRLQDFDRSRLPQIDYARIADPSGLFFLSTTSLRDRTYDVAGLSTALEHRFTTGGVHHTLTAGARVIAEETRRTLASGSFPRAESGDLLTDDTTNILGIAGWAQDQLALARHVLLTPAVRVEYSHSIKHIHRVNNDVQSPHDDAQAPHNDVALRGTSHAQGVMPGLGMILGTRQLNVFSSLYLGYSPPRVSQAITPEGHDANLHAERSSNYELGIRGNGQWLRAEADTFLINFDNQLVSNNPLSGNVSEFVDGGKTRHWGAEGTASVRLGTVLKLPLELDLGGQYSYVHSRFVGGTFAGHAIPYSPAHSATVTLDAAHSSGLSAQASFSYVGAQFTDEQNTIAPGPTGLDGRIPAYNVLDVGARYRHAPSGLALGLTIKSLLDRVYIADRLPNGIFTAGFRQIFATLSWSPAE